MLKIDDLVTELKIEEMAHCASQMCRWRGRYEWISLAEHSVNVYDIIALKPYSNHQKHVEDMRLALSHDLCEAVGFGDVISPIKKAVAIYHDENIHGLRDFEHLLTAKLFKSIWGQTIQNYSESHLVVKEADRIALELEKMHHGLPFDERIVKNTFVRISGWSPRRAKDEFLARYEEIK